MPKSLQWIMLIITLCYFSTNDYVPSKSVPYFSLYTLSKASPPSPVTVSHSKPGMPQILKGTLITYKNRSAHKVYIAGDFSYWKKQPMERSSHGVWFYIIPYDDDERIVRYKFLVDGVWINDPTNQDIADDNAGSYFSIVRQEKLPEGTQVSFKILDENIRLVEFRLYAPNASIVALAGDFNNWNPEIDLLKKDSSGIWRLKKRLPKGAFRYNFVVDGTWKLDMYNPNTASNAAGMLCSVIQFP
ncbi:MAG: glycogen-binding domain-containing protein [Spirochaetes bacterium]|nr:glycogen-binding domain-containing protein [Spirochaetota bacterium]